jgi:hypothetical protein
MPHDVARLRDSALASNETPEACWAAVLLWAALRHHMPAVPIPNDEKWVAQRSTVLGMRLVRRESAAADQRDQVHGAARAFNGLLQPAAGIFA